jgi:hypothetical protein
MARSPTWRRGLAAFVVGATLALSGCVDVDGEVNADGSLSFRYTYVPAKHSTFKSETARLGSAHVRVEKIERDRSIEGYPTGDFVTASVVVDAASQISTAAAFARLGVQLDQAHGQLRVTLPGLDAETRERVRAAPESVKGVEQRALRLSLVLPGPVKGAEPAATIEGRRVTWAMTIRQYAELGETVTLTTSWAPNAAP